MPGGRMHLESKGGMDDYLFVNPSITLFKTTYSKHTNFSQELIEQKILSTCNFGNRIKSTILRLGDLIGDFFLEVKLSNTDTHCYGIGNALIEHIDFEIGGQLIDRIPGKFLNIIGELTQKDEKRAVWDKLVGNNTDKKCKKLLIPLPFFCSVTGKYLPLVAMQYHEVNIYIKLANRDTLMLPPDCKIESMNFIVNYIYLDTEERRHFAQVAHEYLIQQYQYTDAYFTSDVLNPIQTHKFDINFNHPTSELFWFITNENGQPCQSVCLHNDTLADYTLQFDNEEYKYKPLEYAHLYNPYAYNTNTPRTGHIYSVPKPKMISTQTDQSNNTPSVNTTNTTNTTDSNNCTDTDMGTGLGLGLGTNKYLKNGKKYNQYIYSHSFAINHDHDHDNNQQPSGTINMSRINKIILTLRNIMLEPGNYVFHICGKSFNVLRVMSGMAGLAYSA